MKTIERRGETQTESRVAFQPKDILSQVVIAAVAVAPDASSIVYVKRTVEDGKYARRLWRTTFEGTEPEQLTSAKSNDGRPRFSPDGKRLAFISDRAGKPQAWLLNLTGGEPRQISDLEGGVIAAEWSPDGKRLLLIGGSGEKRFIVGDPNDPTARRIRDYTWRLDGVGVREEFFCLWVTDVDDPRPVRLTAAAYNVAAAAWSPDGKHIAFLADRSDQAGLEETPQLWTIDSSNPSEPQPAGNLAGGIVSLAWRPSSHVAFLGNSHADKAGWADIELHVSDGTKTRRLAADRQLNISMTSSGDNRDAEQIGPPPVAWQDRDHVLAVVSHQGCSHPYRFGLDGSVEKLAEGEFVCCSLASGGGRTVVVAASSARPNEIFEVAEGKLRPLTQDGGSWYGPFSRKVEHVQVPHPDGHTIDTWLLLAEGRDQVAPLVINVHGGPNSSFGPNPWLEMSALADAGFHVVYCNPRGSTSYGEKFAKDLEGRWGEPDGTDLMKVIDWAVDERRIADREQLGIMGLSYGGFMTTNMLVAYPGVFKAAVGENPVTDLLSEWASSDFGRFIGRRAIETQSPWENIEKFIARSPASRMHLNHTPLLLLQAENDMRCPPGQSEMVFHILRTLGREVEMVRYPGETHVMLAVGRPDRRVDRLERIVGWFQKHLGSAHPS